MSYHLPVGFRFMPKDEELLRILTGKIVNEEHIWSGIPEVIIYGVDSPWVLFNNDNCAWESFDDDHGSSSSSKKKKKQLTYCFTTLTKTGRNGSKNIVRLCGCGNWHGETSEKSSCDDRLIMKMFKFKIKSREGLALDEDVDKYSWLMHEYSLSKKALKELNLKSSDYVICKITRQEEKKGSTNQDYGNGYCNVPKVVDNVVFQGFNEIQGGYLGKRKSADNDDVMTMEQRHQSKVARLDEAQDSTKVQSKDELEAEKFGLELEDMLSIDDAFARLDEPQDSTKVQSEEELEAEKFGLGLEDMLSIDDAFARLDEPQDSTKVQSEDELEAEKFGLELEDILSIDDAFAQLDEPQDSTKLQSENELENGKFSLELEDMLIEDAKEDDARQEQVQENSRLPMENEAANNQEQPRESMLDDVIDWEAFNKIPIPDDIFQDVLHGGSEEGPTSLLDGYNFSDFFQFEANVKG